MTSNILSFINDSGITFNIYEDKVTDAFDRENGVHVINYKERPDGIIESIVVTSASFAVAELSFKSIVAVNVDDGNSVNTKYINVNNVSVVDEANSLAILKWYNGAIEKTLTLTISRSEFLALAGEGGFDTVITLTSAQILALFTTSIQLIAAPGAGKFLILDSVIPSMDFQTTAYASPGDFNISPTGSSTGAQAVMPEAFIESTADATSNGLTINKNIGPALNLPLSIGVETSNPTTGDSDIKIRLSYRIATI